MPYNGNECNAYNNYRTRATLCQLRAFAAPSGHNPYGGGRPFHGGWRLLLVLAQLLSAVRTACLVVRVSVVVTLVT